MNTRPNEQNITTRDKKDMSAHHAAESDHPQDALCISWLPAETGNELEKREQRLDIVDLHLAARGLLEAGETERHP